MTCETRADFISLDRVAKSPHPVTGRSRWCRASPAPGTSTGARHDPYLFTTQGSGSAGSCRSTNCRTRTPTSRPQIQTRSIEVLSRCSDLTQKMSDELHPTSAHAGERGTGHRGHEPGHRQSRRFPAAAAQLLSTGSRTVSTSRRAGLCGRCSTRSTVSTASRPRSPMPSRPWKPSTNCCRS